MFGWLMEWVGGLGRRSGTLSFRSRTSWGDVDSFVVEAAGDILAGTGDRREPLDDVGLGCCLMGGCWL